MPMLACPIALVIVEHFWIMLYWFSKCDFMIKRKLLHLVPEDQLNIHDKCHSTSVLLKNEDDANDFFYGVLNDT